MATFSELTGLSPTTKPVTAAEPVAAKGPTFTDLLTGAPQGTAAQEAGVSQPAIHPSVGGFLSNVLGDFGDMARGVTGLIGMGVHDIGEGVKNLIPGQQSGEEEGYQLWKMAKAFPEAIQHDYARRYGGVSNIARGLYEDPLSYVMDAFMVSAAVGKGAQLAGKAGIIGEDALKAVTGGSIREVADKAGNLVDRFVPGVQETVQTTGRLAPGSVREGIVPFTLPVSPLRRAIKVKALEAVTYGPGELTADTANLSQLVGGGLNPLVAKVTKAGEEAAALVNEPAPGLIKQALKRLDIAETENLPVLKPYASAFLQRKLAQKLTGISQGNWLARRDQATMELKAEFDAVELPYDNPLAVDQVRGLAEGDLELPEGSPIPGAQTAYKDTGRYANQPLLPASPRPVDDTAIIRPLVERFKKLISLNDNNVPGLDLEGRQAFNFQVPELSEALLTGMVDDIAEEVANTIGGNVVGKLETFSDASTEWRGVRYSIELQDKTILDLNIADRQLLDAQSAWNDISRIRNVKAAEYARQQALLAELSMDPEKSAMAQQALGEIDAELYAAEHYLPEMFNRSTRKLNSALTGAEYDPQLELVDRLRVWGWRNATKPWIEHDGGTFYKAMQRAYGPARLNEFHNILAAWEPEVKARLLSNDPKTELELLMKDDWGLSDEQIRYLLDERKIHNKSLIDAMDAIRQTIRKSHVIDGNVVNWTWKDFYARMGNVPAYFPHFRASKSGSVKDFFWRGSTMSNIADYMPSTSKGWAGVLMERGDVLNDPFTVYNRVGAIYARHAEMQDFVGKMAETFGRLVPEDELRTWVDGGPEVLWNPHHIYQALENTPWAMDEIYSHLRKGASYEEAASKMIAGMQDRIIQMAKDGWSRGDVYAMPRYVADKMAQQAKLALGWKMRMFWDGPMNLWKSLVLGLSPRWIINNFMGNMVFMGIRNPSAIIHAITQLNEKNEAYFNIITGKYSHVTERGFFAGVAKDLGRHYGVAEEMAPNTVAMAKWLLERRPARMGHKLSTMIRDLNGRIEDAARRGVFISAIEKENMTGIMRFFKSDMETLTDIGRNGLDDAIVLKGERSVNATLGDYTTLSPIERQIVRRVFLPFYPFYRHAVKFLVKMPVDTPFKASILKNITQMDDEMNRDLPGWLYGAAPISSLGDEQLMFRVGNMNPLQIFDQEMAAVSLMNPVVKAALEFSLGRDMFTGEEFEDKDIVTTHSGQKFRVLRNGAGAVIGVEPFEGVVHPSVISEIGANIPQLGILGIGRYNPDPLWSAAGLMGVPLKPYNVDEIRAQQVLQQMEALLRATRGQQ